MLTSMSKSPWLKVCVFYYLWCISIPLTSFLSASNSLLTSFDSTLGAYAWRILKTHNVEILTGVAVKEIEKGLITLSNGQKMDFGLCVWSTGIGSSGEILLILLSRGNWYSTCTQRPMTLYGSSHLPKNAPEGCWQMNSSTCWWLKVTWRQLQLAVDSPSHQRVLHHNKPRSQQRPRRKFCILRCRIYMRLEIAQCRWGIHSPQQLKWRTRKEGTSLSN